MVQGRLVALLRTFRLPPDATVGDLRKAYLKEAKRLHPDGRVAADSARATQEFTRLRAHYEEAKKLLDAGYTIEAPHPKNAPDAHPSGMGWTREDEERWGSSGSYESTTGVPVVGLPTTLVHRATATVVAVAVGVCFTWLWRRRKQEVEHGWGRNMALPADNWKDATARRNSDSVHLRQALEGCAGGTGRSAADEKPSTQEVLPMLKRARSVDEGSQHVEPQYRNGMALSSAHVAAEDGHIWWLERCGASTSCHGMLEEPDRRMDTPLHRCARYGQVNACRTLLRLGVNPAAQNLWRLWPEDLAAHAGHVEVAALLRGMRLGAASERDPVETANSAWRAVMRHPDGFGTLAIDTDDLPFNGKFPSESLRHAINHAAGDIVLRRLLLNPSNAQDLHLAGGPASDSEAAAELAVAHARAALAGTGYTLEEKPAPSQNLCAGGSGWDLHHDGAEVCGLLTFEHTGVVTADASGHFIALKPVSHTISHLAPPSLEIVSNTLPEAPDPQMAPMLFLRLDSVRGAFWLTAPELNALTKRYTSWKVLRLPCADEHMPIEQRSSEHQSKCRCSTPAALNYWICQG